MKTISIRTLATVLISTRVIAAGQASAGGDKVKFPEDDAEGVLHATVERGNIHEEIFMRREAMDAAKNGQPIPSGTVITLVDYRDGELFRYLVMEKRTGWGTEYSPRNAAKR